MNGYFSIGKAKQDSEYVPRIGEVCIYERDSEYQIWDTRIGDGKTLVKDLPPLPNYDIYERVRLLENELTELKRKVYE